MQPVTPEADRYDGPTMFFHWATAILVVLQFAGAWTIDDFSGRFRVDARSVHITLGITLAALLAARLAWRVTSGRRLPLADPNPLLNVLAKLTHWGLYALLVAMVCAGFWLTWVRGDSIYNLFSVPAFDPGNRGLRHQAQEVHSTIGWIIIAVVGLHALAVLVHHYVWRDRVLARMLPYDGGIGRRRNG